MSHVRGGDFLQRLRLVHGGAVDQHMEGWLPGQGFGHRFEVRHVEVREHAHAIVDALLTGFPSGDLARALDDVTTADALSANLKPRHKS